MKHNTIWIKIFILITLLLTCQVFVGCGSDKKKGEGSKALEERLSQALKFDSGSSENGEVPSSTDSSGLEIKAVKIPEGIYTGQGFLVILDSVYSEYEKIDRAYVAIEGYSSSYIEVGVNSINLSLDTYSYILSAKLLNDNQLQGHDFTIKAALVTVDNVVGSYNEFSISIGESDCEKTDELCDGIDNDCDGKVDNKNEFDDIYKECTLGEQECLVHGYFICSDDKISLKCNGDTKIKEGTPCISGKFCLIDTLCNADGICSGGTERSCAELNDSCNNGLCNEDLDSCVKHPDNEGESCEDGLFCTENEICYEGECKGSGIDCSNIDADCTMGMCSEEQSQCVPSNKENGSSCGDEGGQCIEGNCGFPTCDVEFETKCSTSGAEVEKCLKDEEGFLHWVRVDNCLGWSDVCGEGICSNDTKSCIKEPKNNGTSCDDELFCTKDDICESGYCTGTPFDCSNAVIECYTAICDEANDECILGDFVVNGSECGDSADETCMSGVCGSHDCDTEDEKRCSDTKEKVEICLSDSNGFFKWDTYEDCISNNLSCDESTVSCISDRPQTVGGTWGIMSIHHYNQGYWGSESTKAVYGDNGAGTISGLWNSAGQVSESSTEFSYSFTPESNGTITVTMSGESGAEEGGTWEYTAETVLSDDGSIGLIDNTNESEEQLFQVWIKMDDSKEHSITDITGDYYESSYSFDNNSEVDRMMSDSGLLSFDPASGSYFIVGKINQTGTVENIEYNGTYSVDTAGRVEYGGSYGGTGYIGLNSKLVTWSEASSSTLWANSLFMKSADKTYTTADISGKWVIEGFGDENGSSYVSVFGLMNCDDTGKCLINVSIRRNSILYNISEELGVFTVLENGIMQLSSETYVPHSYVIGNNGQTVIANMSFNPILSKIFGVDNITDFSRRLMFVGVKCSGCSDLGWVANKSVTASDYKGTWNGDLWMNVGNDRGPFPVRLVLTASDNTVSGTLRDVNEGSDLNISGTVENGVYTFELPNSEPDDPLCDSFNATVTTTLNHEKNKMNLYGQGTFCEDKIGFFAGFLDIVNMSDASK